MFSLCFRFVPDRAFAGTDRSTKRDGPVQFEKEEEDPFGIDDFLTQAKRVPKRKTDDNRTSRSDNRESYKKRR